MILTVNREWTRIAYFGNATKQQRQTGDLLVKSRKNVLQLPTDLLLTFRKTVSIM
jgi:hypothetical protein